MYNPIIFRNNYADALLDELFGKAFAPATNESLPGKPMRTDIIEKEDSFELAFELPGFNKEDIEIAVEKDVLTVSAEHKEETAEKDENTRYLRRECRYGRFSRSFTIDDTVNSDEINAKLESGILTVTVPKKEPKAKADEKKLISISA